MSDWWSKKLAGETPTPSRRSHYPVTTYPTPMAPPQPAQPVAPQQDDRQANSAPASSFTEALRKGITNGGEAARRDIHNCPACGSVYVFSRAKGTTLNGANPAPRCYECGWNGLYEQAEQTNWS